MLQFESNRDKRSMLTDSCADLVEFYRPDMDEDDADLDVDRNQYPLIKNSQSNSVRNNQQDVRKGLLGSYQPGIQIASSDRNCNYVVGSGKNYDINEINIDTHDASHPQQDAKPKKPRKTRNVTKEKKVPQDNANSYCPGLMEFGSGTQNKLAYLLQNDGPPSVTDLLDPVVATKSETATKRPSALKKPGYSSIASKAGRSRSRSKSPASQTGTKGVNSWVHQGSELTVAWR